MQKGMGGLGLAAPIASLSSGLILLIYYVTGKWKKNMIIKTNM
jgi:hypothetical protein